MPESGRPGPDALISLDSSAPVDQLPAPVMRVYDPPFVSGERVDLRDTNVTVAGIV
jgi:hypothetical protein